MKKYRTAAMTARTGGGLPRTRGAAAWQGFWASQQAVEEVTVTGTRLVAG
jgi:hypothetical protein